MAVLLRRSLRALLALSLGCLAALGALAAYLEYCESSELHALPALRSSTLARKLLLRESFRELLGVLALEQGQRFETVWDGSEQVFLDRRQFEAVPMFGRSRYRYRPNLRLLDFSVWTGLEHAAFQALATPRLETALRRSRVRRKVEFETDEMGFKRTDFAVGGGLPSVLFLGDSFTEGLHVPSPGTFVNLFGVRMAQVGLAGVPVNAGVNGYGPLEAAWTAAQFAPRLDSRVVILNLYPNDAHPNDMAVIEGRIANKRYDEMFSHLDTLASLCQAQGRQLVVSIIPHKRQLVGAPDPRHFQRRVQGWCARRRLPFLDVMSRFRSQGAGDLYFRWDPHLNERGHRAYADFLFERTLALLRAALPSR